jgi:hypothetical protein
LFRGAQGVEYVMMEMKKTPAKGSWKIPFITGAAIGIGVPLARFLIEPQFFPGAGGLATVAINATTAAVVGLIVGLGILAFRMVKKPAADMSRS